MIRISEPFIGQEEVDAVIEVLKSGHLAQGNMVDLFEDAFSRYVGTKYAIAVNSGTSALHLSLLANGVGAGDEVITTPFSFIATANSILYCNAKPVFADINEDDFCINPDEIEKKVTPRTKALVVVHLYGLSCDMDPIIEVCDKYGIALIEDACQAHGAEYNGRRVGSFGTGCFSFYPTKNMTCGEGGMITTDDGSVAEAVRLMRNHGSKQKYFHEVLGYNYRMTDIAAAIGLSQLKNLESFIEKRIYNSHILSGRLAELNGIKLPKTFNNRRHVFHQYTIRVMDDCRVDRQEFGNVLGRNGVGYGVYYPIPITKQPLYKNICKKQVYPVSEKMASEVISLPVHPSLSGSDLDKICSVVEGISYGD